MKTERKSNNAESLSANAGTFGVAAGVPVPGEGASADSASVAPSSPGDALSLHGAAGHSVRRPRKPRDLAKSASSTLAPVSKPAPDPVRGPLGLLDRAEAIFNDLDDLLMDACDARLDHAVLKSLLTARSQITHSMHALASI